MLSRTRQLEQTEQPANNTPGIKPNQNDSSPYTVLKDSRLRDLAKQVAVFVGIVVVTGKLMEWFVDNYVMGPSTVGLADLQKAGE